MKLYLNQLDSHLASNLASIYLVGGDEPLLINECCDAIRAKALAEGYSDREVLTVETGFDWGMLATTGQSMSLFSDRRLLELRIATGRPGDVGSRALVEWASELPEDTLLLIISGKLDQDILRTKWAKATEKAGVMLRVYTPDINELPNWIGQRLRQSGLHPEPGVAEQLAYHFEGNLLAVSQEITKMALSKNGTVTLADLDNFLSDNARFNVFRLVDVCLQGDAVNVQRIVTSLHKEGISPVLVLWALAREIRSLAAMAQELAMGASESQIFQAHRIWPKRQALLRKGLKRMRPNQWLTLLQRASRIDRVIKGRASGSAWQQLVALSMAVAGVTTGVRL